MPYKKFYSNRYENIEISTPTAISPRSVTGISILIKRALNHIIKNSVMFDYEGSVMQIWISVENNALHATLTFTSMRKTKVLFINFDSKGNVSSHEILDMCM